MKPTKRKTEREITLATKIVKDCIHASQDWGCFICFSKALAAHRMSIAKFIKTNCSCSFCGDDLKNVVKAIEEYGQ